MIQKVSFTSFIGVKLKKNYKKVFVVNKVVSYNCGYVLNIKVILLHVYNSCNSFVNKLTIKHITLLYVTINIFV